MDSRIKNTFTLLPLISGVFVALYLCGFIIAAYLPFIFASRITAELFFREMGFICLFIGMLGVIAIILQNASATKKISVVLILVLLSFMGYVMSQMGANVANDVTVLCRHRTENNKVVVRITNKDAPMSANCYEASTFTATYYRISREIFPDTPDLDLSAYTCFGKVWDDAN